MNFFRSLHTGFWVLLLSLSTAYPQVFEDEAFRSEARKGVLLTYDMQFEAAHQQFSALQEAYPNHPAPTFLLGLNRWWESYISPSMDTYHTYILQQLVQALEQNTALKQDSSYYLEYTFFQYMCHAFKARLHTLRREWLKAANAGRKAFPYLKRGFVYQEQAPEFYFGSGIYHYYADEYPKSHPIIKPFMVFFPEAGAEMGIAELAQAVVKPNFAQFEAAYYLGDIYLKRGNVAEGLKIQQDLYERFPNNTWFRMEYGRALVENEVYEPALHILNPMIEDYEYISGYNERNIVATESHYSTYLMSRVYLWKGKAELLAGRVQQAIPQLQKGEQMARLAKLDTDDEYLPAILYYLGQAHDQISQREQALVYYKKVLACSQNLPYRDQTKACMKRACR